MQSGDTNLKRTAHYYMCVKESRLKETEGKIGHDAKSERGTSALGPVPLFLNIGSQAEGYQPDSAFASRFCLTIFRMF